MNQPSRLFLATKAMVVFNDKVLLIREAPTNPDGTNPGRYDLPGGRIQLGEPFDESLQREIHEETGLEVKVGRPFHVAEWRPVVRGESWQIVGIFFACEALNDHVELSREHDAYLWIDPKNYQAYHLIDGLASVFEVYLATLDLTKKSVFYKI